MKRSRTPFIITLIVLAFLYLPIVMLVVTSFNESRFGGVWTGFSFKWYQRLFQERAVWNAVCNTLIVALSATVVSTILGSFAAFSIHRYKTKLQKVHYGLIYAPLIVPDVLMGIGLLLFFVSVNIHLGLFTIFLAHTTFCVSYVTMVVLARLQNFDFSVVEAAQDLGANRWFTLRKVMIPLLSPGIIAGAILAFTLSIDDFVISFFVAGPGATTLPIYVYSMIKFGSTPVINALSVILVLVTFVIVGITQRFLREQ